MKKYSDHKDLKNAKFSSSVPRNFPDSCQIPWYFQVFQTKGHPNYINITLLLEQPRLSVI